MPKRSRTKGFENEVISMPETALDDLDQLVPPIEIGNGNLLPHQEPIARRTRQRFGPLVSSRSEGPRPGGSAPDKRVRIDPAPCEIPKRTSDTVLF